MSRTESTVSRLSGAVGRVLLLNCTFIDHYLISCSFDSPASSEMLGGAQTSAALCCICSPSKAEDSRCHNRDFQCARLIFAMARKVWSKLDIRVIRGNSFMLHTPLPSLLMKIRTFFRMVCHTSIPTHRSRWQNLTSFNVYDYVPCPMCRRNHGAHIMRGCKGAFDSHAQIHPEGSCAIYSLLDLPNLTTSLSLTSTYFASGILSPLTNVPCELSKSST